MVSKPQTLRPSSWTFVLDTIIQLLVLWVKLCFSTCSWFTLNWTHEITCFYEIIEIVKKKLKRKHVYQRSCRTNNERGLLVLLNQHRYLIKTDVSLWGFFSPLFMQLSSQLEVVSQSLHNRYRAVTIVTPLYIHIDTYTHDQFKECMCSPFWLVYLWGQKNISLQEDIRHVGATSVIPMFQF